MPNDPLQQLIGRLREQLTRAVRHRLIWQASAVSGFCFWAILGIDRWIEPRPELRAFAWVLLVLAVLVWWIRNAWPMLRERFSDEAIAQLIALKHPLEGDLIATAIELEQPSEPQSTDEVLVAATRKRANKAASQLESLRLAGDTRDTGWAGAAVVAWGAALLFFISNPTLGVVFAHRLALSHQTWPRAVSLNPHGFTYDKGSGVWKRKVARGQRIDVVVEAEANPRWRLPNELRARTWWTGGASTKQEFVRVGQPTSAGRQRFRLPVDSVTGDMSLMLRSGDARIRLQLLAVDRPTITGLTVKVTPPEYLEQAKYEQQAAALTSIPEGAEILLEARVNKPLKQVTAELLQNESDPIPLGSELSADPQLVTVDIPPIFSAASVSMSWSDVDGVEVEEPYVLPLEISTDNPPTIELSRDGVAKGVTPKAVLRCLLSAQDDRRIARTALSVEIDDDPKFEIPLSDVVSDRITTPCVVDLLSLGGLRPEGRRPIEPGMRIIIRAIAEDQYDLQPRQSSQSEPLEFEVVTEEEVLARLGFREQELRARLEVALSDAQRLDYVLERLSSGAPVTEIENSTGSLGSFPDSQLEARKLRAEVTGVEAGYVQARDAMLNNRLDQPALLQRIVTRILEPLSQCKSRDLDPLVDILESAEQEDLLQAKERLISAITTIEQVLSQIESNETYNKVVAELRELIREQRRLNRLTDLERTEQAKRLLLGPQE